MTDKELEQSFKYHDYFYYYHKLFKRVTFPFTACNPFPKTQP